MLGLISITGVKHLLAVLAKKSEMTPYFCTVSVEPLVIYDCPLYNLKLSHHMRDIPFVSILWPWNPSQRSLKVIKNDTSRSGTHGFLLTLHSNHGPILYRFRDKRRFPPKITNFPTPVYWTPRWRGTPWNWVSAQWVKKLKWWGYQTVKKVLR